MAGGKLSFSVAINLLTDNFNKNANAAKNSLRAFQMQVLTFAAALGAGGLGLSGLISRFIDVAKETNRVTTALKNVSGGTAQFAENQRYLLDLANRYGLEINALTGNFAKFTASASMAGMGMMEQRKIFDSVSRAVSAFSLSASESDGVMLALSQMMGKGKISSEELRKQMGEKLPIAMAAMAKAAGTTQAGLEKMLKQGQLMSADILPKFAEALREMIPNVDTDNLETSLNRLKNTFTGLVDNTGIQNAYKSLIDNITKLIESASNNIKGIVNSLVSVLIGVSLGRLFKWIVAQLVIAERQAMMSAARAAKDAGEKFDKVAWKAQSASETIRTAFKRAMLSIRSTLVSIAPMAVLALIGAIVAKFKTAYDESKRIKGLFDGYKTRIDAPIVSEEIAKIKALQSEYNKGNTTLSEKKGILSQINGILGTSLTVNQDVNKEIAKRVSLLESVARAELAAKEVAESENEIRRIGKKSYNGKAVKDMAADWAMSRGDLVKEEKFKKKHAVSMTDGIGWENGLRNDLDSFIEYANILKDAKTRLGSEVKKGADLTTPTKPLGDGKDTPLQKAEKKYAKALEELAAKREIEKMTDSDYDKAYDEIDKQHYIEARGSMDKDILNSKHFKDLQDAVASPKYDKDKGDFEKVKKEHENELKKLSNQKAKGAITEEQYNEELKNLIEKTILAAGALDSTKKELNEEIGKYVTDKIAELPKHEEIKPKERDKTFDYKKSKTDIISEDLKIYEDYRDELKKAIKDGAKDLDKELNDAMSNVKNLGDALKIEEVREDIKNLERDLTEGLYSGVKDIASSSDRVVSAFSNLRDVMSDVDASGWEKIMSIWNTLTTTIDAFLSIVKMIETLTEVTKRLTEAKKTESTVEAQATSVKVISAATGITADKAAAEVKKDTAVEEIGANTAVAASEGGKSAAKLPFPANLIAIGASIAAIIGMFAAIPKFATGGIFAGGTASGDKGLARLNYGEMILNHGQQSKLFQAINSGQLGSGNGSLLLSGGALIKGSDIYLSLNNYMKKTGKRF